MKNEITRTPFGQFMERLRNNNKESICKMAKKLDIGRSYLAQIELGTKNGHIPLYLIKRIYDTYSLTSTELNDFKKCVLKANKESKRIDLVNVSTSDREEILNYVCNLMICKENEV